MNSLVSHYCLHDRKKNTLNFRSHCSIKNNVCLGRANLDFKADSFHKELKINADFGRDFS